MLVYLGVDGWAIHYMSAHVQQAFIIHERAVDPREVVTLRIENRAPGGYTHYLLISGCPVPVYRVCTTSISSSPQTTELTYAVQAGCSGYNVVQTGLLISNLGCSFDIDPPTSILFPAYHNPMLLPSCPMYWELSLTYHDDAPVVYRVQNTMTVLSHKTGLPPS
jgi:hypothetical protein